MRTIRKISFRAFGLAAVVFAALAAASSCIRENREECYAPKVFSVTPSELTVAVGSVSGRFLVKSNSPEPLEWTLSDTTVAELFYGETPSELIVRGLRCGRTTVRFSVPESWLDGKFYHAASAEATVTVVDSVAVRLRFSLSDITVDEGATVPIPFTVDPALKLSWKSLDGGIASVDTAGNVTGLKPGRTKVVATAGGYVTDDYTLYGFASDTCAVTVMGEGYAEFDPDVLDLLKGASGTARLRASASPVSLVTSGEGTVFSMETVETSSGLTLTISALSRGTGTVVATVPGSETAHGAVDTLVVNVSEEGGLYLNPAEITVAEGAFRTVRAFGPSSGKIVWTVENPDIAGFAIAPSGAEVSVGGRSAGRTVLVASQAAADGYAASIATCTVIVTGTQSLALSDTVVVFDAPGETRRVTASVTPDAALQWSSSSPGVVVADVEGSTLAATLSAVAPGTAVVTVKAPATEFRSEAEAYCRVFVRDDPQLKITPASVEMTKMNETAALSASTRSDGALTWSCSDPSVAVLSGTGKSVTLTAKKSGTCTVTVSQEATDAYRAATATCTVRVDIIPSFVDGRYLYYNGAGELLYDTSPSGATNKYGKHLDVDGGDGTVRWKLRYSGDIPSWVHMRINGSGVGASSDGSLGGWRTGSASVDVTVDEFWSFVDSWWSGEDPMMRRAYVDLVLEDGRVPDESGVMQSPSGGYKVVLEEGSLDMGPEGGEAVVGLYCSGYCGWHLMVTLATEPSGGSLPGQSYDWLWTEALAYFTNELGWYNPGYSVGNLWSYSDHHRYYGNWDYIGAQHWHTNSGPLSARYRIRFEPNTSSYTRVFTISNDPLQSGAQDLNGPLVFRVAAQ